MNMVLGQTVMSKPVHQPFKVYLHFLVKRLRRGKHVAAPGLGLDFNQLLQII